MNGSRTSFVIAVLVLGAALGLGSYTFAYARGWAYMTDDPRACANCHVMNEQYDGWIKSSHRSVAVCNDCHVPHAWSPSTRRRPRNGFWHSFHFTTGTFPEPIRALPGEPGHRGDELPPLSRARRPGDGDARTRRIARHLVYPLSRVRGPYGTCRDQRRGFVEVNRVRPETKRNARVESRCRPDRGDRDGALPPRRSRHSSSTSWRRREKRRIRSSASWS